MHLSIQSEPALKPRVPFPQWEKKETEEKASEVQKKIFQCLSSKAVPDFDEALKVAQEEKDTGIQKELFLEICLQMYLDSQAERVQLVLKEQLPPGVSRKELEANLDQTWDDFQRR